MIPLIVSGQFYAFLRDHLVLPYDIDGCFWSDKRDLIYLLRIQFPIFYLDDVLSSEFFALNIQHGADDFASFSVNVENVKDIKRVSWIDVVDYCPIPDFLYIQLVFRGQTSFRPACAKGLYI